MVTYNIEKQNYAEISGLSTDTKPTGIGAVPSGSKFYEIDTDKTLIFNGDAGDWYDKTQKKPTKLEVASNAYKVTYSDNSTNADATIVLEGNKATFVDNGIKVSCDAITIAVAIVGDVETATYDGDPHTATGYEATPDKDVYNVGTDMEYLGGETPSVSRTEVGKSMMGLSASDFKNLNDQYIVTFTVTDGYVEIEEAQENENET